MYLTNILCPQATLFLRSKQKLFNGRTVFLKTAESDENCTC